ncbi:ABC transporter ATP-binding protein [Rhodalgimonas zhirmunskyi]|uniref:ABC transporter ATP-binding protein n=1 Tax=Rhodalgimonas zhirmunskyi TaxID=2964767 RepID=A0AAJ1UBT4_9RHOB|nr:ABC transporter ATP-binding protein [Rhodoalgimonas zhirmunskyi]MDQ2093686.1 ABC transporter ATP-binding protein [Rhodoalgimonas zhirmunskyi]
MLDQSSEKMLEVSDLHAYYGKSHILQGVNFHVNEGEIVALLGRNGVGRSTTCKAVMGEVTPKGSVKFRGTELAGKPSYEIAKAGLGYVPENRDIFPGLTTRQNLILGLKPGQKDGQGRWSMEMMFDHFENLRRRADIEASVLSGGEKQMLTVCRTLMGDPDFIMIDEPTEGLAPKIVEQVGDMLEMIAQRGVSILLVEQKLTIALRVATRVYVMGHGHMVFEGTPEELMANKAIREEWLEV